MKIIVLDGFTLNPGDLSWDDLNSLGTCEIYDRTPPEQILSRAAEAEILLTNKTELTREHIEKLTKLKYIGILATGTNIVDLAAASAKGIIVSNVPAYGTSSVAQTTIALLLELTQHVGLHSQSVHQGRWTSTSDWCYWERPLIELDGLTLGIIGLGRIGTAVAYIASSLGMNVIAASSRSSSQNSAENSSKLATSVKQVALEHLFRQSDVVSLHCPLTPETKHLINAQRLSWMKPSAFLLNTSRGQLVDEDALAAALNSGRLAGAGLDVLTAEPPPATNPLLTAKNCIITPHLAWATKAARSRLMQAAVENVRAFLRGNPQNVVN
jgi:Lactate dehydrogenase and related dehydrogenases